MAELMGLFPSDEEIYGTLDVCVGELCEKGALEPGSAIVLGCSTSEVAGAVIGHGSVPALGETIAAAMIRACARRGMRPVFQCCEHLNRALVMEAETLRELRLTRVHAVPQPKAGGSVPAAAWKLLKEPCLVMHVQADAGIDIGDTLIGMHLRPVAVPFRGEIRQVGHANVVCAWSRLPYVGGERAVYQ